MLWTIVESINHRLGIGENNMPNISRLFKQRVTILLAFLLVLTSIPIASFTPTVYAAEYFTFPYASTANAATQTPVNSSVIDLTGVYSSTVPATLTIEIQNQIQGADGSWFDRGQPNRLPNSTPIISGTTQQEFTVKNLQLFSGMNKITVTTPDLVEGTLYVYFVNAPGIEDITLSNSQSLMNSTPAVNDPNQFFIIRTVNATSVTVNGIAAAKYGPDAFSVSNLVLKPGRNKLTFVVSTATDQITLTRDIIYINGPGALVDTFLYSSSPATSVPVDTGEIVSPAGSATSLPSGIKGTIYLPSNNANNSKPEFTQLYLTKDGMPLLQVPLTPGDVTYTFVKKDGLGHAIWNYEIDGSVLVAAATSGGVTDFPIAKNGTYQFSFEGTYLTDQPLPSNITPVNSRVAFVFKNDTAPYITGIQQVYGVNETNYGTAGVAGPVQSNISSLPVYLQVNVHNRNNVTLPALGITVNQNGSNQTPAFTAVPISTTAYRVKIDDLKFIGDMSITFTVGTDTYTTNIKYVPIPALNIYQIYDGMNLDTNDLPAFRIETMNFLPADLNSIKFYVNGGDKSGALPTIRTAMMNVNALQGILSEGANTLRFEAIVNGVPIQKILTVYYFTKEQPKFATPYPVPVINNNLPEVNRPIEDIDSLFKRDATGGNRYNTTEKLADIIFSVTDADKIVLMLDGHQMATIDVNDSGDPINSPVLGTNYAQQGIKLEVASGKPHHFRLSNLPLNLGTNSLVIRGIKGPVSQFIPIEIIRNVPPFEVLSPKLPEERVINQNFVHVVIRAEGVDQVLVGKDQMKKVMINDIEHFIYDVINLKPGNNTIKYTVVRGSQKTNDKFDVYYANTNTVGAQHKTSLSKSSSVKAFNNALQLSFPKGTMLTPNNETTKKIELFDNQKLLFGIADRIDGRTQKTFNHFGTIRDIEGSDFLKAVLQVPQHFGYASDLYWIDAGFFESNVAGYIQNDGMQPYYGVEANYNLPLPTYDKFNVWRRSIGDSWLKPTDRGTITLKYDAAIRNQAANKLAIWRYGLKDDGSLGWENLGGKVNTSNKTVTADFDYFGYFTVFLNTYGFDDAESHPFARDDIELLYSRGIMNAKNQTEFGAYEPTTRGEFVTMMVKALGLPLDYDPNNILFYDVPHSLYVSPYWDWRYIETAGQKGIARGVGSRMFAPDEPLTREQAATIIASAMNLKLSTDLQKSTDALNKIFADGGKTSTYARPSIEAVYKAKIMVGSTMANPDPNGKPLLVFNPSSNITRAETAKIVAEMMRKYKRL